MKTTHKILLLVAILLLIAAPAMASNSNVPSNAEEGGISILLDGQVMNTDPVSYIDAESDHTLVPQRFVSESLGAEVKWDAANRKVTVLQGGKKIEMNIDSRNVYIDGNKKMLAAGLTPKLVNDRTMVPLRFLSEAFGYDVGFDDAKRMPTITTEKTTSEEPINASRDEETKDPVDASLAPTSKVHKIVEANGTISIEKSGDTEIRKMRLDNPKRIVFDLLDTSIKKDYEEFDFNIDELRKMRVSQFDSDIYGKDRKVVRMVLDLNESYQDPDVNVNKGADNLSLSLTSKGPIVVQPPVKDPAPVIEDIVNDKKDDKDSSEKKEPIAPSKPVDSKKRTIVLDAGHGGKDPGAVYNGIQEKDLTLTITKKLEKALANSYNTVLTRNDDSFINLGGRTSIANRSNPDMFLSIHANAFSAPSANGVEAWYIEKNKKADNGAKSKYLATTMSKNISDATGFRNRGPKDNNNGFAVLKPSSFPSTLLEIGFLSNPGEAEKLKQDSYQNKIVQAIVDGINSFFNKFK